MAYRLTYNNGVLFEPFSDDVVYDAKLTARYNNPDYLDFTIPYGHSLYSTVAERAGVVRLYFDSTLLFDGEITSIETDMEGNKTVSCDGALAYLEDSLVRPYSTIEGEEEYTAPSTVNGLFQWYIDQHNEHTMDTRKQFTVDVNQGASLDTNNYIYRSNTGLPTTWSEINDKLIDSLGGYLFVDYEDTVHILNYYADVHEKNTQVIDFGVNISDFSKTIDTSDQYTAVRPSGATPSSEEGSSETQKPITIESLPDGGTSYAGITKKGDVVYSVEGVARYGYREYAYSNTDIETQAGLLESACRVLNNLISPTTTITVSAVDLSLYMEGYTHLKVGQAVRIRSKLHDEDEYLMINSITLDLQNPGNSEYEIGEAYDTLTGQQSAYLKSLNSGINKSLDSVAALDTKTKETAEVAKTAAEKAEEAKTESSEAKTTAEQAETNSSNAQKAAEEAKKAAESTVAEAKEAADKASDAAKAADEATAKVTVIESNVTTKLNEFNTKVDAATTASEAAEKNASDALNKATDAYTSVGKVQSQLEDVETAVSDVDKKATNIRDELSTQIETVSKTMTADYAKKSELSETKASLESTITQSAAGVLVTVSESYATKEALSTTTEATAAAKDAADKAQETANKNATDLANTIVKYDSKVEDLQNQIDGSIETWFYDGEPTTENAPAKDWTDEKLKNNHLGDLYYDNVTGYSYRWQLQNGVYSWARITDVDVTKALANAAKAQDTADSKRRVFVTTPTTPYDQGDLWVQGTDGDILRCQIAKTNTQSYDAADWVKASKYTDDTATDTLRNYVNTTYTTKTDFNVLADRVSSTVSSVETVKTDLVAANEEIKNAKAAAKTAQDSADTANTNLATAQKELDNAKADLKTLEGRADVSDEEITAAKQRITDAETAVTKAQSAAQAADAAAKTAQETADKAAEDLSKLTNRVSTAETSIKQNSDAIALRATKTELDDVENKVDSSAINWVLDPYFQNGETNPDKWQMSSGTIAVGSLTIGSTDCYMNNGEIYKKVSAGNKLYMLIRVNTSALSDGTVLILGFHQADSTKTWKAWIKPLTSSSIHSADEVLETIYTVPDALDNCYLTPHIFLSPTTSGGTTGTAVVSRVAIVDVTESASYSDARLQLTADSITSTVTSMSDQMNQLQSSLEQTADSITAKITNVETAVDNNTETTKKVNEYMTFDSSGLTIGRTDSTSGQNLRVQISDHDQKFLNGDQSLLTIDGTNSRVEARNLTLGKYQWQERDDRLQLVYIG